MERRRRVIRKVLSAVAAGWSLYAVHLWEATNGFQLAGRLIAAGAVFGVLYGGIRSATRKKPQA